MCVIVNMNACMHRVAVVSVSSHISRVLPFCFIRATSIVSLLCALFIINTNLFTKMLVYVSWAFSVACNRDPSTHLS